MEVCDEMGLHFFLSIITNSTSWILLFQDPDAIVITGESSRAHHWRKFRRSAVWSMRTVSFNQRLEKCVVIELLWLLCFGFQMDRKGKDLCVSLCI